MDVVVFGATGFVGRLTAEYLAEHAPPGVTIGLAGRSKHKLEALGFDWPLVVADLDDEASLAAMASQARVVVTTVGPYWPRGLRLVDACIAAGAHYTDLTGEILFARASVERHAKAEEAGSKIVLSCGFDSIPSDLGVLMLHDKAGELDETTLVVKALKARLSGGTLASLKGLIDEARKDGATRKILADPYALGGQGPKDRDLRTVKKDPDHGWIGPFMMASYNTRIVRRSHALLDYGPRFRYSEVSGYRSPLTAVAVTAGLGGLAAGLALKPTRMLLDKVLPEPGEGPSEEFRESGYFKVEIHGAGHKATVAAKGDPGYAATAVMLGESALCLALDKDRLPERTGVLTPATAMGEPLVERLRAAGMTLAVNA
jgi:short subunit dehydrogenase-like uncharacterized protein